MGLAYAGHLDPLHTFMLCVMFFALARLVQELCILYNKTLTEEARAPGLFVLWKAHPVLATCVAGGLLAGYSLLYFFFLRHG